MPEASANFLRLPPERSDPATSRYAILPVPYEGTVTYKTGTVNGPAAILEASRQVETLDEELQREFISAGIATHPAVRRARDQAEQTRRVKAAARPIVKAGRFLLTLGGEHSITPALVEVAAEEYGKVSVLQIDAHADLRDHYKGNPNSHACVMRRVLEGAEGICQVGIRSFSRKEFEACPKQVKHFITPAVIESDPRWIDRALKLLGRKVYVTIDIDGFDPSYAPGTGTPEPGGLDWRQVTALLRRVCTERKVVAADIVEVRPIPPNHITEYLAARLAYKIIAYTQIAK